MASFKTLVYSPDVRAVVLSRGEEIDLSPDLVRGVLQREGEGVSFFSAVLANKGLRYTNRLQRNDPIVVFFRRLGWLQCFAGYLNSVPVVNLYPGTVKISASCTLKRLKYTYWDPGLTASMALFDQMGISLANQPGGAQPNAGDAADLNKDAGLGHMLQNLLVKVGGWTQDQIIVQDFPTAFVDYVAKATEGADGRQAEAIKKFKALFDYDESTGAGSGGGSTGDVQMGPLGEGQKFNVGQILASADAHGVGDEGARIGVATGLVESNIRVLANPNVPESYDYPHEGEGSDHDSIGIFQQRGNGAWGTVAQRMNPRASADMFFNALTRFDWRSMDPGMAAQRVQGSAYPDKYGQRMAEATQIVAEARAGGGSQEKPAAPTVGAPAPGGAPAPATGGDSTQMRVEDFPPMPSRMGSEANWQPDTVKVARVVAHKWPELQTIGGWRPQDAYPDHPSGRAADIMIPDYNSERGRQIGTDITNFLQANAGALGVQYTIWRQEYWGGDGRNVMEDRGSDTQNHFDHVHVTTFGNSAQGGLLDGSTSGAAPGGPTGGGGGSTFQNKLAKNLFGYLFDPTHKYNNGVAELFVGERASVNDEPLLETVRSICTARMCKFQSAPTGEFLAYYPDYFGLDGTPAKLDLEDIELKNFQVEHNDNSIVTHMFTQGVWQHQGEMAAADMGWTMTEGVATIEEEWLFRRLIEASVVAPETTDPNEFLERFGIRPLREQFAQLIGTSGGNPALDKMMAMQRFMQKWAEQTATTVDLTFMPELFPGMRINLVGHDVQVYVERVSHSFDFQGGFSTSATIMAPARPSVVTAR